MARQLRKIPAACTRAPRQLGIGSTEQFVCGFTRPPVEAVKGMHLVYAVEEAPKADQVTRKPKVILAASEKAITPVMRELCLSSRKKGSGVHLSPMVSMGFLSVVSPDFFLPFVPVFLSSVSEPCPYPSCLCLPSRTSFFHCSAPGSRPQPAKSRWLLSPVPAPLGQWPTLLDWLSLTSDLKGIASPGYEIFLCKMLGARIGNPTVGSLITRPDRPTLLFLRYPLQCKFGTRGFNSPHL